METLTLSEFFTLIAPGASVAIAAVAAVLSVAYFLLAKRLFNETEKAMDGIEKSVNQMYSAMIRLSQKSGSYADEIESQVLQLEGAGGHLGRDAEVLNNGDSQAIEKPPFRPSIDSRSIYEKVSGNEVLHLKASQINEDSLQARISAIGGGEEEEEEEEEDERIVG